MIKWHLNRTFKSWPETSYIKYTYIKRIELKFFIITMIRILFYTMTTMIFPTKRHYISPKLKGSLNECKWWLFSHFWNVKDFSKRNQYKRICSKVGGPTKMSFQHNDLFGYLNRFGKFVDLLTHRHTLILYILSSK